MVEKSLLVHFLGRAVDAIHTSAAASGVDQKQCRLRFGLPQLHGFVRGDSTGGFVSSVRNAPYCPAVRSEPGIARKSLDYFRRQATHEGDSTGIWFGENLFNSPSEDWGMQISPDHRRFSPGS